MATAVLALVAAACNGGSGDTTTTSEAPTTTAPVTSTTAAATTTTTVPLIENGAAIATVGDRNEVVEAVQFLMNCNGYGPLDVDGVFGPATAAEVAVLQADLGREQTGDPDDETLAQLARGCDDSRRVIFDEGATERLVVGNVATADADRFFVRAAGEQRMTLSVASATGEVTVTVSGSDGAAFDEPPGAAWSGVLPSTQDYLVDVVTDGGAATYELTIAIPELPERDEIEAAAADTVVIDGTEEAVVSVCVDTTGVNAAVAETGSGYLVVAQGAVGTFGVEAGGLGAPVEFVFKDGSPGYLGFRDDVVIEADDGVLAGEAIVFVPGPGNSDEPFDLAFSFTPSVVPCSGDAATSISLRNDGLGIVEFGAPDGDTIAAVQAALPTASPALDTGWVELESTESALGVCADDVTELRIVQIDNLALYFVDGATSFAPSGTRHFAGWEVVAGVFPFGTSQSVGLGDTPDVVAAAHPDGFVDDRDPDIVIFITSPPGSDAWLRAFASDGEVDRLVGGRVCES